MTTTQYADNITTVTNIELIGFRYLYGIVVGTAVTVAAAAAGVALAHVVISRCMANYLKA